MDYFLQVVYLQVLHLFTKNDQKNTNYVYNNIKYFMIF